MSVEHINALLDATCRWFVSFAVFVVLVLSFDLHAHTVVVPLYLIFALLTATFGKLLKRVLKQARPSGAWQRDGGMPSSHAVSLGFLSCTAAVGIVRKLTSASCSSVVAVNQVQFGILAAFIIELIGAYLSFLRVRRGHHTLHQVIVGFLFGTFSSASLSLWNFSYGGHTHACGGRVDELSWPIKKYLNYLCIVASCLFAFRYTKKFMKEDYRKEQEVVQKAMKGLKLN